MNEIRISIEVRIEACSESAARHYASAHGVDANEGKWYPNRCGDGGRLYAASTTPFPGLPPVRPSSKPCAEPGTGMCGNSGLANKFCANPVHTILHRGIHLCEWQCASCGALLHTIRD